MSTNRFGHQPALTVLRDQRWSITALSRELDLPLPHLRAVLYGYVSPSHLVRDALARHFDVDVADLFTADALATEYHVARGRRVEDRLQDPRFAGEAR